MSALSNRTQHILEAPVLPLLLSLAGGAMAAFAAIAEGRVVLGAGLLMAMRARFGMMTEP
jgi:hypothetical protein